MKISGIPYYRMLVVGNESDVPTDPLHMYMYDSNYNQPGAQIKYLPCFARLSWTACFNATTSHKSSAVYQLSTTLRK